VRDREIGPIFPTTEVAEAGVPLEPSLENIARPYLKNK
jgi:hypothetical protein